MEREMFYFASANTGDGFVCHFDSINDNSRPAFQYIIKGGSGTGKSTLMKKIGKHFYNQGFNIEYFFCSSDSDSLDGVRIVEKNISIIDGTAPHTFDATLPMIENKILNVGEFINIKVKKHSEKIKEIIECKKECYKKIYTYLECAKKILQLNNLQNNYINNKLIKTILKQLKIIPKGNNFNIRKLFIQSFSNNSIINFEEKNIYKKIININCNKNQEKAVKMLVLKYLEMHNNNMIIFYDLINSNNIYAIECENYLIKFNYEINNNYLIKKLINLSQKELVNAKNNHKKLEKYYIKNVDFSKIDNMTKKVISEIETM